MSKDDVLPRLRDLSPGYGNVIKAAVEEIERLRAELARYKQRDEDNLGRHPRDQD